MNDVEAFAKGLAVVADAIRLSLETVSVLCVVIGLLSALHLALSLRRQIWRGNFPFAKIRLGFGAWLSLALECQLGADIVATTTAPSTSTLAQLGVVALIRTFLNVFLAREMEAEQRLEKQAQSILDPSQT